MDNELEQKRKEKIEGFKISFDGFDDIPDEPIKISFFTPNADAAEKIYPLFEKGEKHLFPCLSCYSLILLKFLRFRYGHLKKEKEENTHHTLYF